MKSKRSSVVGIVGLALAVAGSACSSEPGGGGDDGQQMFARTMVRLNSDGTVQSKIVQQVTAAEQKKNAERIIARQNGQLTGGTGSEGIAAEGVSYDSPCDTSYDMQMFSQTGYTGSQLCLYNGDYTASSANLSTWGWSAAVRSYIANDLSDNPGYFSTPSVNCNSFLNYEYTAGVCTQAATVIHFYGR